MTILRILLLILLFLLGRRLWRAFRSSSARRVRPSGPDEDRKSDARMKDLTDQDISDADFEEIP
jgi:hypothetical protein